MCKVAEVLVPCYTPSVLMELVKTNNAGWFNPENIRFFGDTGKYWIVYGKSSGSAFLARSTYAWSDMFGHSKRLHFRLNEIDGVCSIGNLVDVEFRSLRQIDKWLEKN